MVDLSVILPCYNTPNLLENFKEILSVVKTITNNFEIILVDDGSKSFPDIKQSDKIKVITHLKNFGKGQALMSGFKIAKGEIICFIDSDLQIPAQLLKPYYEIITGTRSLDILVGSKRHYNSKVIYSFTRRLISFCYQTSNRIMFGLKILDSQAGIKMFQRKVIEDILPTLSIKGFAIDLELLVAANEMGYKTIESPLQIRQSFSSTVNSKALLIAVWDTLFIWCRKKIGKYKKESAKSGEARPRTKFEPPTFQNERR